MMIHDIIKIKYVQLGYIRKNYPYHIISDEEMFNAFIDFDSTFTSNLIDPDVRFFNDYYPNPFLDNEEYSEYSEVYDNLKQYICTRIADYLYYHGTAEESSHQLPSWVYTYMLGEVVYQQSEYLDIEDTLDLLECSNLDNEFTLDACIACYKTSLSYVNKLTEDARPATIFGEPHVIKSLRLG